MARKKKNVTPTLAERQSAAEAQANAALSVFEVAASDLEAAAEELADVGATAHAEARRLIELSEAAETAAEDRLEQARLIRGLVGVPA